MTKTNYIRWGGRVGRYKEFKGAVRRQIDPVANQPVMFATDLQFENWLLHRFNRGVITLRRPHAHRLVANDSTQATVHLDVDWADGTRELQVVGWDARVEPKLRRLGETLGARVTARSALQIRQNMTLLSNLRHLRRQMQQNSEVAREWASEIDDRIAVALSEGPTALATVYAVLDGWPQGAVDARLGQLHVKGSVDIDLEGAVYGPATTVRTL